MRQEIINAVTWALWLSAKGRLVRFLIPQSLRPVTELVAATLTGVPLVSRMWKELHQRFLI